MLRLEEFIDAVSIARAVGERPYGHFDHDANRLCGPSVRRNSSVKHGLSEKEAAVVSSNTFYEVFEDPETGEVLYRQIERE
jgi:hypothetical protein